LASLELIAEEIEDPLAMMPMIYPLKAENIKDMLRSYGK
jgi:hypothetical protein